MIGGEGEGRRSYKNSPRVVSGEGPRGGLKGGSLGLMFPSVSQGLMFPSGSLGDYYHYW